MNKSIQIINSIEPINLTPLDINPLMSACEIKVFYLGANRNGSYIDKSAAQKIAKTVRGAPIVGHWIDKKEDFGGHGECITLDDEGVHFQCDTSVYGFVPPDANLWFQDFEDELEDGTTTIHTYLMVNGYLWTGQFKEANLIVKEGRPHQMELDEDTLEGKWAMTENSSFEFFIVDEAILQKLCVLGNNVEPCFEGSSITAPKSIGSNFSLEHDKEIGQTLYNMMQDLKKYALKEGGQTMENQAVNTTTTPEVQNTENNAPVQNTLTQAEAPAETVAPEVTSTPAEDVKPVPATQSSLTEPVVDTSVQPIVNENLDAKFQDLSAKYEALVKSFEEMKTEYTELQSFKTKVEDEKKDEMIAKFYMLSDADKKEIIDNKSKYTLDEIEAKLSVIAVRNKCNFSENTESAAVAEEDKPVTTFSLESMSGGDAPEWIKALRKTQKSIESDE